MKFTAQTICKFGIDKYNSTSNIAEFIFYYCANGYKMYNQSSCYKCFESCFNCSEPGNNNYHNCNECNSNNSIILVIIIQKTVILLVKMLIN